MNLPDSGIDMFDSWETKLCEGLVAANRTEMEKVNLI